MEIVSKGTLSIYVPYPNLHSSQTVLLWNLTAGGYFFLLPFVSFVRLFVLSSDNYF
jgi:hypothetical protein